MAACKFNLKDDDLVSDHAIAQALRKLHRQRAASKIAFGRTRARQKAYYPVSDDLPADVELVTAAEIRAEAKRRRIKA